MKPTSPATLGAAMRPGLVLDPRGRRGRRGLLGWLLLLVLVVPLVPAASFASDHADPITLGNLDAGLTGLFVFQDGDDLVFILTVHRGLTSPPPYDLEKFEYTIFVDLHSKVTFSNAADVARYGGTVQKPEGISNDAAIRFRLTRNAGFQDSYPRYEGFSAAGVSAEAGVYDDPFIFPRFFGTNVIAMAVSVPLSAFPANQRDWLIWATTTEASNGKLIDHVGRSNRTQLGRFDFLNTLPPAEHMPAIAERFKSHNRIQKGFSHLMQHVMPVGAMAGLFEYVLQIRPYDLHPDVMIFSLGREPGFPNGRRLSDDVAGLTCAQGDCVLQEVAFIEGAWPRQTVNDKEFATTFPYLAPPHPERPEEEHHDRCGLILLLAILAILALFVLWKLRAAKADEVPYVRPYRGEP